MILEPRKGIKASCHDDLDLQPFSFIRNIQELDGNITATFLCKVLQSWTLVYNFRDDPRILQVFKNPWYSVWSEWFQLPRSRSRQPKFTNEGIIRKSDNIDSGAPILLSVGDMLRPLEARKPNWRGLLSGAVVIIMLVITIYTIYKTKKGWCPRTGEGQRLMGM